MGRKRRVRLRRASWTWGIGRSDPRVGLAEQGKYGIHASRADDRARRAFAAANRPRPVQRQAVRGLPIVTWASPGPTILVPRQNALLPWGAGGP